MVTFVQWCLGMHMFTYTYTSCCFYQHFTDWLKFATWTAGSKRFSREYALKILMYLQNLCFYKADINITDVYHLLNSPSLFWKHLFWQPRVNLAPNGRTIRGFRRSSLMPFYATLVLNYRSHSMYTLAPKSTGISEGFIRSAFASFCLSLPNCIN